MSGTRLFRDRGRVIFLSLFIHLVTPITEVKMWLKSLRLHKYYKLFEQVTYQQMIRLTAEDLERLGNIAEGE